MKQYLDQIDGFAEELGLPLLKGSTPQRQRDEVYEQFRRGELKRLVVSKIANFSVDLPDAAVAIQVSGMFGSRQEEAQRLGRILRPKPGENQAHFYSIVSRDTIEQEFALNRQLFLCEQGYEYRIVTLDQADAPLPAGDEICREELVAGVD
jgi:DNA excision repair protein ERCC-3